MRLVHGSNSFGSAEEAVGARGLAMSNISFCNVISWIALQFEIDSSHNSMLTTLKDLSLLAMGLFCDFWPHFLYLTLT